MTEYRIRLKGGPGSGFYGHKGRKGQEGGSLPRDSASVGQKLSSSNPVLPKTKSGWIERLASKRSLWNLSSEEFANEVNDTLIEKFPELKDKHDELADLIHSAIGQRNENINENILQEYTIYDIAPNIGDYVSDVEQNTGKHVTWREVYDILNDFGNIPEGMSDSDWDKLTKKLSKSYA